MPEPDSGAPVATPELDTDSAAKLLPPYHVIIENDDDHTQDFVINVLRKVFGHPVEKAFELMMVAHETGESVVWTGPKEVAELKYEQILTFHQHRDGKDIGPLSCRIEPAE